MGFPIYTDTKHTPPSYLNSGLIYNSVLVLCIVSTITCTIVVYNVIEVIYRMYVYINKQKVIKIELK